MPPRLSPLPVSPPDRATRCLCHAVHLNDDLREYVLHTVVDSHLRAVCPAFGINLIAVARHAALAQRHRAELRTKFIFIRIAAILAIVLAFIARSPGLAVGLICVILIAAWAAMAWSLRLDRLTALKPVTELKTPPESHADPLPAETENRIREVENANAIVYANGEFDPFIGSGRRLHFIQLHPIDVTRSGKDSQGNKRTIKPFDAVELHEYLAKKVPSLGFSGLRPKNRLYVHGDYADQVPGLLPDKLDSPRARIDSDWVKSAAKHPRSWARTYVCMERVMKEGQLVVGMYVRAWLEQDLLSIERVMYFIPSLQNRFQPTRDFITQGVVGAGREAAVLAAQRFLPVFFGGTISGKSGSDFLARLHQEEQKARQEIGMGYGHDYGARTSLREAVAAYDFVDHAEETDVMDAVRRLSLRLLDCIGEFLDDHGIDTGEYKRQAQHITNQVSNIGSIQAGTAVIGGQGNIVTGHGAVNNFGPGNQGLGQQNPGQPGTGTRQTTP